MMHHPQRRCKQKVTARQMADTATPSLRLVGDNVKWVAEMELDAASRQGQFHFELRKPQA